MQTSPARGVRAVIRDNDLVSTEHRTQEPAESVTTPAPRRQVVLLAAVAAFALALDFGSKSVVVSTLEGRPPVRLGGGLLYFDVLRNSGAAFSIATGMTWLLSLIAIGVVVTIIRLAPKLRSAAWAVGLGLVLGGALGNLVDRLFRAPGPLRGHVVDFISVFAPYGGVWPVFNLADSAICVGGVLLVLFALLGHDYDGSQTKSATRAADEETAA